MLLLHFKKSISKFKKGTLDFDPDNSLIPQVVLSITKCDQTRGGAIIVPSSIQYHNLILRDTISWEGSFCHRTAPHSYSVELKAIFILFSPQLTFGGFIIIIQPEIS